MGFFTHLGRDVRNLIFRDSEQNAIPSMDGALGPNDRLDRCEPIGEPLSGADDAVAQGDRLYVSAGRQVLRLSGEGFHERSLVHAFDSEAGGLALHPDGRLIVCVAGRGLAALDPDHPDPQWLAPGSVGSIGGLTAVTCLADGSIWCTEGAQGKTANDWLRDLLDKGASGRVLRCSAALDRVDVVAQGLAWPNGIAPARDGALLVTESWRHGVRRIGVDGTRHPDFIRNLPAYPARIHPAKEGYHLALFGVRTHLIEFLLKEDEFRQEMLTTVAPEHWIGPALASGHDCLEPMQIGSIKALGIQKPWAPPRSYGLYTHVDEGGEVVESLHSRAGGRYHGITAACDTPQGVVIVAKGAGRLLLYRPEAQS